MMFVGAVCQTGSVSALEGMVVKIQYTCTDGGDESRHTTSSFLLDNPHQLALLSAGFSY